MEAAEAAYLCTEFDKMEKLVQIVLDQAQDLLDKVKVYEVKILALTAQNHWVEASRAALEILKKLGLNLFLLILICLMNYMLQMTMKKY